MKKIYVLIFGVLFSATEAQLLISDKIYQQMENREKSVRMKTQRIALQDSYIYTIVGTRNFKSGKSFRVKKIDDFHRFTLNKRNRMKYSFSLVSDVEMRQRAMGDIKKILPKDIADSCSITSVGYEYEQRDSAKPKIVGSVVMLHRKLDGIPVRGSSYVFMSYDSTGNLSYMDIQWDRYNKTPAQSTVESIKINKIHRKKFDEIVESISQDFHENNLRGSLDNSVQTIVRLETEQGESMLVPGITFIGQYSSKDTDESIPMTFDIPSDASLMPVRKAIVSR